MYKTLQILNQKQELAFIKGTDDQEDYRKFRTPAHCWRCQTELSYEDKL